MTFLLDTGAQVSALQTYDAIRYGIVPDKKGLIGADTFDNLQSQPAAKVKCWLSGDASVTETLMIIGPFLVNLLGLDILKGKSWIDDKGRQWSFGSDFSLLCLLQAAPPPRCLLQG